jgi:hypothetical protein
VELLQIFLARSAPAKLSSLFYDTTLALCLLALGILGFKKKTNCAPLVVMYYRYQ